MDAPALVWTTVYGLPPLVIHVTYAEVLLITTAVFSLKAAALALATG